MKNIRSLTVLIALGALTLVALGQSRQDENPSLTDTLLERTVPGDDEEYFSTTDAFYSSLSRTRVAGGLVKIIDCEGDIFKQIWKPSGLPLRQVLDAIVAADLRHRWEVQDGVVNLLPASGEPLLLDIRINEFRVKKVTSALAALDKLLALPEVRKGMDDHHLKPGVALVKSLSSLHPPTFSVYCKDVTLRQSLNAIARAQGQAVWQYIEVHCDGRKEVVIRF